MSKTDDEMILELKEEIKKLNGTINYNNSAGGLRYTLNQILEKIHKLTQFDKTFGNEYNELSHTLGKEVEYAIGSEREMNKKNAAKKRKQEFETDIRRAVDQISMELHRIIN